MATKVKVSVKNQGNSINQTVSVELSKKRKNISLKSIKRIIYYLFFMYQFLKFLFPFIGIVSPSIWINGQSHII
jgi:hypothetical protein